jgi:hypothetical protein
MASVGSREWRGRIVLPTGSTTDQRSPDTPAQLDHGRDSPKLRHPPPALPALAQLCRRPSFTSSSPAVVPLFPSLASCAAPFPRQRRCLISGGGRAPHRCRLPRWWCHPPIMRCWQIKENLLPLRRISSGRRALTGGATERGRTSASRPRRCTRRRRREWEAHTTGARRGRVACWPSREAPGQHATVGEMPVGVTGGASEGAPSSGVEVSRGVDRWSYLSAVVGGEERERGGKHQ